MPPDVTRTLTVAAYALFGSLLAWSRLTGLDNGGYCCDEIRTAVDFVGEGPRAILTGRYVPNNHELFSLLGWATTSIVGESEAALRLGAAIPFILGVVVVTVWLHVRVGALAAVLYLAFATVSPLLLDISRQARGYGLAFLAMSVMVVAALEAVRSGRAWAIATFWAAGVVGTWTLPHFAVAFGATGVVLLMRPDLRTRCLVGGGVSVLAVAIWYAPHFDDIWASSSQDYGNPIHAAWLLTAPFDQILLPALTALDETLVDPSLATLLTSAVFAVLVFSSPLVRRREPALVLGTGVIATVIAFWITSTQVVPRFFTFLLVPLFILMATGCASILGRLVSKPAPVRTAIVLTMLGTIAFLSAPFLIDIPRLPRDSTSEAAASITASVPPSTPVYAHVAYHHDLSFYLGRSVTRSWTPAEAREVCASEQLAVYVDQPFLVADAEVPCTRRPGARHYRFEQYARGQEINVWIIPPAGA